MHTGEGKGEAVARVLSAAGWDSEFTPSQEAFEEWKAALAPGRTARPTLAGLAALGVLAIWPGLAPGAAVAVFFVGLVAVLWLSALNLRVRGRAERRLAWEYEAWRRARAR